MSTTSAAVLPPVPAAASGAAHAVRSLRRHAVGASPARRFVTVDGVRLAYDDVGSGPAVVCLHAKEEVEAFCRQNPLLHLYALVDLDDFFWPYTTWYALREGGRVRQLALLYSGQALPTLLAYAEQPGGTLRDLRARASQAQLKADFEAYLDGFSPNVQDILENFEFRNQIPRLSKADALGTLIEKLLSPEVNLSPNPVLHPDGSVKHPGLDNHAMGTVFEELVRRFNEENNEEAGEHWTPRDAVKLMARPAPRVTPVPA